MDFLAKTSDAITDLEQRHANTVRELASECLVLLENDGALPIRNPGRIAVYGNGARHTVQGGGGSGEVNTRLPEKEAFLRPAYISRWHLKLP